MGRAIGEILSVPKMIQSRSVYSSQVDGYFHSDIHLSHIVIVDELQRPLGLLTRSSYYIRTGGAYGFQLYHKKYADVLASRDFLKVGFEESVSVVARWAMARPSDRLYDPIMVTDGEMERLMGTVTIRELLENSEKELVAAKELAEEATRQKSEFLAAMSHEIRTPMNAVINLTEAALRGALSDSQRNSLETVRSSADHLLRVINDILDFSKMEAGKLEFEMVDFDLFRLLEMVVMAMRPLCQRKGLDLDLSIAEETPRYLKGDPSRLRQIVFNLVSNAIKFTEKGGVFIEVGHDSGNAPRGLRFTIKDTGLGIPSEKIPSLFTRFTQADASVARKFGGTGLGLSISRQLCELMGGRIWVESVAGLGSVFSFTVVLQPGSEAAVVPSTALPPNVKIPKTRILAAEDSSMNAKVLEALFECLGIEGYQIVADGARAIEMLRKERFDIVLMDIEMPIMDGFEAVGRMRRGEAGEEARLIPIIALTAHALSGFKDKCVEAGMNAYLTKPLNLKLLRDTIMSFAPRWAPDDDMRGQSHRHEEQRSISLDALVDDEPLRNLGGDANLLAQLRGMFFKGGAVMLERMRTAAAEGGHESLRRLAHTMKGDAAAVGARACHLTAVVLEKAATAQEARRYQSLIEELEHHFRRVVERVETRGKAVGAERHHAA